MLDEEPESCAAEHRSSMPWCPRGGTSQVSQSNERRDRGDQLATRLALLTLQLDGQLKAKMVQRRDERRHSVGKNLASTNAARKVNATVGQRQTENGYIAQRLA